MKFAYNATDTLIIAIFTEAEINHAYSYLVLAIKNSGWATGVNSLPKDIISKDETSGDYYFVFPFKYHLVALSMLRSLIRAHEIENNKIAAEGISNFIEEIKLRPVPKNYN